MWTPGPGRHHIDARRELALGGRHTGDLARSDLDARHFAVRRQLYAPPDHGLGQRPGVPRIADLALIGQEPGRSGGERGAIGQRGLEPRQRRRRKVLGGDFLPAPVGRRGLQLRNGRVIAGQVHPAAAAKAGVEPGLGPQLLRPARVQLVAETGQVLERVAGGPAVGGGRMPAPAQDASRAICPRSSTRTRCPRCTSS